MFSYFVCQPHFGAMKPKIEYFKQLNEKEALENVTD